MRKFTKIELGIIYSNINALSYAFGNDGLAVRNGIKKEIFSSSSALSNTDYLGNSFCVAKAMLDNQYLRSDATGINTVSAAVEKFINDADFALHDSEIRAYINRKGAVYTILSAMLAEING